MPRKLMNTLMGVTATSLVVIAGTETGFFGEPPHHRSEAQKKTVAALKFLGDFRAASPERKYALQYLTPRDYNVNKSRPGKGILGGFMSQTQYRVGQTCLAGTAYDTSPNGEDGLFSHGKSYTPAGPIYNSARP